MTAETLLLLTLPLPPSINAYYIRGRILTPRARAFRDEAGWMARRAMLEAGLDLFAGALELEIDFYFRDGDADNRIKPLWDALNRTVWIDDQQVSRYCVERHIISKGEQKVCIKISRYVRDANSGARLEQEIQL